MALKRLRSFMNRYIEKIEKYCMTYSVDLCLRPVELEHVLHKLEVLDSLPNDNAEKRRKAHVGKAVELFDPDDGSRAVFELVLPGENDPQSGRLSVLSPLGAALLGLKAGERAQVSLFGNRRSYLVCRVSTPCG